MVLSKWYGKGFLAVVNKEVDWTTDIIRAALLSSAYVPDQDAHDYFNDVSGSELPTGSGYTAEGKQLTSPTATYAGTGNVVTLDADDVAWPGASLTAAYAVIYVDTGNPATSALLAYVDFGGVKTSDNDTFTIEWSSEGILKVAVA